MTRTNWRARVRDGDLLDDRRDGADGGVVGGSEAAHRSAFHAGSRGVLRTVPCAQIVRHHGVDMTPWWCHSDAHGHHRVRRRTASGSRPGGQGDGSGDRAGRRADRLRSRLLRPPRPHGRPVPRGGRDHQRARRHLRRGPPAGPRARLRRRRGRPVGRRRRHPGHPHRRHHGACHSTTEGAETSRITLRLPEALKVARRGARDRPRPVAQHVDRQRRPRGHRGGDHRSTSAPSSARSSAPARRGATAPPTSACRAGSADPRQTARAQTSTTTPRDKGDIPWAPPSRPASTRRVRSTSRSSSSSATSR